MLSFTELSLQSNLHYENQVTPRVNACRSCRGCIDASKREVPRCLSLLTVKAIFEYSSALQLWRLPGACCIDTRRRGMEEAHSMNVKLPEQPMVSLSTACIDVNRQSTLLPRLLARKVTPAICRTAAFTPQKASWRQALSLGKYVSANTAKTVPHGRAKRGYTANPAALSNSVV